MEQFLLKLLLKQIILTTMPQFPFITSCYKVVDSQTSCYVKVSESEILEKSESEIWKGWSQTFFLRLCNPV